MLFKAPYGAPELLCVMPSPLEEDNEGCEAAIQVHTSITNITRVYRRVGGFRRLIYSFNMTHDKRNECENFVNLYTDVWWEIVDYRSRTWRALLTSNPVDFVEHRRHRASVTLEFLGVRV